jgi:F420-dependent oxidoreductase-like protein
MHVMFGAMRFSFWTGNGHPWSEILDGCTHAEATGWDGIWVADHFLPFMGDDLGDMHEAWSLLAGIAAAVPRVRIGTLVAGNTYRNPAVLAKIATTVDHISGGRAVLGIGSGWQENEHVAYGIEYGTVGSRLDMLEEALQIIRGLLHEERTDLSGTYYEIANAPLMPKPVQDNLPILVGGGGEKRTLRMTAKYADEWNVWGTPEIMRHKNAVLDGWCEDIGRDPGEIHRTAVALLLPGMTVEEANAMGEFMVGRPKVLGTSEQMIDQMGEYRDAGVDEFIVPDFTLGPLEQRKDSMDMFITEVAPGLR